MDRRPQTPFPADPFRGGYDRPLPQQPQQAPGSPELGELTRRLGLDLTTFANKLRALLAAPIYRDVTVTLLAGDLTATAEHGLGRGYLGAAIEGQSSAGAVYVLTPDGSTSSTVVTVGIDVAAVVDITVQLRVR
jgi:hypothetical protein